MLFGDVPLYTAHAFDVVGWMLYHESAC